MAREKGIMIDSERIAAVGEALGETPRSAWASIRGFWTQVIYTAIEWLSVCDEEVLIVEGREDIDRAIFDENRRLCRYQEFQVKVYEKNLTIRSKPVWETLFHFLTSFVAHRQVDRVCQFVFLTTASLGIERRMGTASVGPTGSEGEAPEVGVLHEWQLLDGLKRVEAQALRDKVIESIRDLYAQYLEPDLSVSVEEKNARGRFASEVRAAINWIQEKGQWKDFLSSVVWKTDQGGPDAAIQKLEAEIESRSSALAVPPKEFAQVLIGRVFEAASKREEVDRALTKSMLNELGSETATRLHTWAERVGRLTLEEWRLRMTWGDLTPEEFHELEAQYRRVYQDRFNQVKGFGTSLSGSIRRLDDVFVEPSVTGRVEGSPPSRGELEIMEKLEQANDEEHHDLALELEAARHERLASEPERSPLIERWEASLDKVTVILGDPGSGKTVVLSFLAYCYAIPDEDRQWTWPKDKADLLPIFVSLASFERHLRTGDVNDLEEYILRKSQIDIGFDASSLIKYRFLTGRCLLLLDGLDEVADREKRQFVAEQVATLVRRLSPQGVRFVVSSRIVGYREVQIPFKVEILTLLDFDEREISLYIEKRLWPDESSEEQKHDSESPRKELVEVIESELAQNRELRQLAGRPLLLSMLVDLRLSGGSFPGRRVELFERWSRLLITEWERTRSRGELTDSPRVKLNPLDVEAFLKRLAFTLLQDGTILGPRALLERYLVKIILDDQGQAHDVTPAEKRNAKKKAKEFLVHISGEVGILIERAPDRYGFLHRSFQEYFCGCALADLDVEERWSLLEPRLHNPSWQEPILFCAGRLGIIEHLPGEVEHLVHDILERSDPTEEDLHRQLLLASAIACADVSVGRSILEALTSKLVGCLPTEIGPLREELIRRIARMATLDVEGAQTCLLDQVQGEDWRKKQELADLLASEAWHPAIRQVLKRLTEDGQSWVRQHAIAVLSRFTSTDDQVKDYFLEVFGSRQYHARDGATALARAGGILDPEVRKILIERLGPNVDMAKKEIIQALATETRRPEVRSCLLQRIDDHIAGSEAIKALGREVHRDPDVYDALLSKLREGNSDAVTAFRNLVGRDEVVRQILIEGMTSQHHFYRIPAVEALARVSSEYLEARDAALAAFDDEQDLVVLWAVVGLARYGWQDDLVKKTLLRRVRDPESKFRWKLLEALGERLFSDTELRSEVNTISTSTEWRDRRALAKAAGLRRQDLTVRVVELLDQLQGDATTTASVELLIAGLPVLATALGSHVSVEKLFLQSLSNPDWRVRKAAIDGIVARRRRQFEEAAGKGTDFDTSPIPVVPESVLSRVSELLDDNSERVRGVTIREAAVLGIEVDRLVEFFRSDPTEEDRKILLYTLKQWIGSRSDLRKMYLSIASDENDPHIREALSAVALLEPDDAAAETALLGALLHPKLSVRTRGVYCFLNRHQSSDAARRRLVSCVSDEHQEVRQAAAKVLGQWLDQEEVRVALLGALDQEDPQVQRKIARCLVGRTDIPEVRDELRSRISTDPCDPLLQVMAAEIKQGVDLGALLERNEGMGKILREILVDPDSDPQRVCSAILILGAAYPGNSQGSEFLLGKIQDTAEFNTFIDLLQDEVRTENASLKSALLGQLAGEQPQFRVNAMRALAALAVTDPEVHEAFLHKLKDEAEGVRMTAIRAIARGIAKDSRGREAIVRRLDDPSFNVRALAVEVLADLPFESSRGAEIWTQLRSWIALDMGKSRQHAALVQKLTSKLGPRLAEDPDLRSWVLDQLSETRWTSRLGAIEVLLAQPEGVSDEEMVRILEAMANRDGLESYLARLEAASVLINEGNAPMRWSSIELCREALEYGTRPWESISESLDVRIRAASILGSLTPREFHAPAFERLRSLVRDERELPSIRSAAYEALIRLVRTRERGAS